MCLLPVAAAASFPEFVVGMAPVTVRAYDAVGYNVNIYGLEVRRIEQQHAFVDGVRVLSIKGEDQQYFKQHPENTVAALCPE